MSDQWKNVSGNTQLSDDEQQALKPSYITTQTELNAAEQDNILKAELWCIQRHRSLRQLLSERFIRQLHKKMADDVWQWAGQYRVSDKNIGVPHYQIREQLQQLLADVTYWIEHQTYSMDEIAIRFHHRLVAIHPFPNLNGRHARLMADLLIRALGGKRFHWGGRPLNAGDARNDYIQALQSADAGNIGPLLRIVRQ
ncbi:MAG: mobile mystery protein B [Candidatus Melainabacteria bacterium]